MCMSSYFHVISGSAHRVGGNRVGCKSSPLVKLESNCNLDDVSFSHDHFPKKDGGVAENLMRANAFKSKNPVFMIIIHPSYINGKDCLVSFQLNILLGFRNTTPINFDFP